MKKIMKIYMALLVVFSSASFAQSKSIDDIPDSFRNVTTSDTTNIADIEWKQFFAEDDLVKLIDTALAKNADLQIAEKNVSIANLLYKQSKWGNVPQLDAFANASSTRLSDNSLNGMNISQSLGQKHVEDYNAGLQLSWEADIWGKIRDRKKAARAEYLQTAEAKKAIQGFVVANVSKGYYDLLMLDAQLDIARKNLVLNDSIQFVTKLQYDSGRVTALAVQQTEAQRLIAARLIPEIEQQQQLQENALSVLTGTFPDAKKRSDKLNSIMLKDNLAAGIPAQLLSRRPDVKATELALQAANAKVGISKASLYPSINITAAGGVNSFEISNWFNLPASLFGSVAGSLTAPLLNGKRLRTQYEVSKAQRDQAAIAFRQTVLTAAAEVSDALVKIDKQQQQFQFAEARVTSLKKAVGNASMLFKNGMANYLEVIFAQGNLLEAELQLASIKKERLASNVDLYRALGGGWK